MTRRDGGAILMRHAHAEWPGYQGDDFERPLTRRGEEQALHAAQAMLEAGHRPARILASPARRTLQTAELVASGMKLSPDLIVLVDIFYNASADTLQAGLRAHGAPGLLMLIAHNPGISDLARRLANPPLPRAFAPADWLRVSLPAAD